MPIPSKTYSSDLNSISNYMRTPPRTNLEPWLTVRKSIISLILSPTSYKFIVLGLLGPFPLPTSFGSGLQFVTLQLLFMNQLHFFGSIHEFHYTISTNFYLYLQYFQKRFSICDRFLSEVFFSYISQYP